MSEIDFTRACFWVNAIGALVNTLLGGTFGTFGAFIGVVGACWCYYCLEGEVLP